MYTASTDAVWKALADPTRRELLDALRDEPRTTGELVSQFPDLGRTTVMKHLDTLEAAGLITHEKRGRQRFNHINPAPLVQIVDRWISAHTQQLTRTALALKTHLESKDKGKNP